MSATLVTAAAIAVLVAFLLSMVEAALQRTTRLAVEQQLEARRAGAQALHAILSDLPGYLSALAFVRVIAESTAAVIVALSMHDLFQDTWRSLLVAIAIMVVLSFALVSVSPRTLGRQHAGSIAAFAAPAVVLLRRVLGPLAHLLVAITNAVTPGRGFKEGPFASEAELRDLVDLAGESDVIEDDEREMIHSVFELGDTITREVMVPRTDMISIVSTKGCEQALSLFLRSGFSRIPVIGEGADDVVGVLYFRDVVRRTTGAGQGQPANELLVAQVMRPATFVPDSKPVDDLLKEMQREQIHLAVVVDEYGGTAGLVTIEDVLEEIVGEITDEYDREAPGIQELPDGSTRVPANLHIDDLAEHFEVTIDEEVVDTVGGLIGKTIGRVPIVGSRCQVAGLELTAERMSGRRHRIASVLVRRLPPGSLPVPGGSNERPSLSAAGATESTPREST